MRRGLWLLLTAFALYGCDCGPGGTRTVRPELVPPQEALDFGKVPVLNEKVLEVPVLNVGRADLPVTNVFIIEDGTPFSVKSRPESVESGQTLPIEVAFKPPAEADYSATLVFESGDEDNPRIEVKLSGSGSTRAIMEVEPLSIDFGRVGECSAAIQTLTIHSKGTAALIVEEISFVDGSSADFSFVGSTSTPATVAPVDGNGLPGKLMLTLKYTAPPGGQTASGQVRIRGTDPDNREVLISLSAQTNRAPVPVIAPLGNGAPGMAITLDGTASTDTDGDLPLTYKWTLRQKPLGTSTTIAAPDQASTTMSLDPTVPGEYEVELSVADSTNVRSCEPARARIVASPAQKLLIEMFWSHPRTDMDLHLLRTPSSAVGIAPDDCFYANTSPDWGVAGDSLDNPQLLRDALTGYGPEVIGYVNPIDTTYRLLVEFAHDHLDPSPATTVTLRIYEYGVMKAELTKTLSKRGEYWQVADVEWPSGVVTKLEGP